MEASSTSPSSNKCSGKAEKTMEHEPKESSISKASAATTHMAFKEHQKKQMRAQCLVYLAFRNQTIPKELHLEIALGKFYTNTADQSGKDFIETKGKESLDIDNARENEAAKQGLPVTEIFSRTSILKDTQKPGRIEDNLPNLNDLYIE